MRDRDDPSLAKIEEGQGTEDREAAKREIFKAIALCHPDLLAGKFSDAEQQEGFLALVAALNCLDRSERDSVRPQALIPMAETPTQLALRSNIASSDGALVNPRWQSKAYAEFEDQLIDKNREKQRRFYSFPRISSALLASAALALVSMLGSFRDHPLYEVVTESDYASYFRLHDRVLVSQVERIVSAESSLPIAFRAYTPQSRMLRMLRKKSDPSYMVEVYDLSPYYVNRKLVLAAILDLDNAAKEFQGLADELRKESPSEQPGSENYKYGHDSIKANGNEGRLPRATVSVVYEIGRRFEFVTNPLPVNTWEILLSYKSVIEYLSKDLALFHDEANSSADRKLVNKLVFALCGSTLLFLVFWFREKSDRRWIEYLLTDEGVETLAARIVSLAEANSDYSFSSAEVCAVARRKDSPWYFKVILGSEVSPTLLQEVAELFLARLLAKGVIVPSSRSRRQATPSFSFA